jgi:hypothetical protein
MSTPRISLRTAALAGLIAALVGLIAPAAAAPTNYLGVNAHQPAGDVLDAAKALGVSWVRIDFNWFQAQPSATKTDWSLFDTLINEAQKRGLKVFPSLGYGPAWASEPDTDGKPHNNVPKVGAYQAFCQAAAARYKGKITHWGLWNEPNLDFFEGTKQQWIDRVVIEGIKGIKAGCPGCKVVGPELASIGSDHAVWLADSLKALKQAGLMYDIISWHIYGSFKELKPGWACWDGDLFHHDLDAHRVCFGLHSPLSVREVLINNKLSNLPVWLTETGYTAPSSDAAKKANQVTYYRRVVEEQLERPWWTHTFFYEIVDDNLISDKWGMAVRTSAGAAWPGSYQLKPVWSFIQGVLSKQPALGGSGSDCSDELDNDGDKLIDFPADKGCASAADPTETAGSTPDAGPPNDAAAQDSAPPSDGPGPGADGPAPADAAAETDGGAGDGPTSGEPPEEGCGCVAGRAGADLGAGSAALALLVLLVALRRRP